MRLRRAIVAAVATAILALAGAPLQANAECWYVEADGSCTNPCMEVGKVVTKVVNVDWYCTM